MRMSKWDFLSLRLLYLEGSWLDGEDARSLSRRRGWLQLQIGGLALHSNAISPRESENRSEKQ